MFWTSGASPERGDRSPGEKEERFPASISGKPRDPRPFQLREADLSIRRKQSGASRPTSRGLCVISNKSPPSLSLSSWLLSAVHHVPDKMAWKTRVNSNIFRRSAHRVRWCQKSGSKFAIVLQIEGRRVNFLGRSCDSSSKWGLRLRRPRLKVSLVGPPGEPFSFSFYVRKT